MRWIRAAAAGLVLIVAAVIVVGMLLPKGHRASRTVEYDVPPGDLFATITDVARFAEWRSGVTSVDILDPVDGKTRFREHGPQGAVTYSIDVREPNTRLVTRIDDASLPFGGTWTFELTPTPTGTSLTITEDGEVYNPIFRVMSKLFFSPYATIDVYQADLRARLQR